MNRIFLKVTEQKNLLRIVFVVTLVLMAFVASVIGAEAGPWDTGP